MSDPLTALLGECLAIGEVLDGVDEERFSIITNCPPWTLKELVVHLWGTIGLPDRFEDSSLEVRSAADYFARTERETDEYGTRNVDRTQRAASRFATGTDAVYAFVKRARRVVEQLMGDDLDRVIAAQHVGAMTLGGYVSTRVVAVAAHGLDVTITLGRESVTTSSAMEVCTGVLADLLGAAPPATWSDADLLGYGTGRTPLDDDARAALGPLAERFPLLS